MSILDLINDFKDGKIVGVSKHKLRDESKQERFKSERLKSLKKESQMQYKLLVITELAIPFNPATGKEDDVYDRDNKFRPMLAQSTVMKMIKGIVNENKEAKDSFMRRAGVEEWDTEDVETITDQDRLVLNRYRVPRTFTLPVTNVNLPAFTGNVYGKDYLVEVEKDPDNGEYIGEIPLPLKVNKLMSDMIFEEINQYRKDIKEGKIQPVPTDKEQKEAEKKFWTKVTISGEFPRNYVMAVGIKLDAEGEIAVPNMIAETEPKDMMENMFLFKRGDELKAALAKYNGGSFSKVDFYDDFFELDMNCPKESDPMQLGLKTRYEKSASYLKDNTTSDAFIKSVNALIDSDRDWEQIFLSSVYISKFNSSIEDSFLTACSKVIDLNDTFMTNKVVQANSQIIELIFGEAGEDKVAEATIGMGEEGSLDEKASKEMNKEHTINISAMANNTEGEEIKIDELEIQIEDNGDKQI